MSQRRQKKELSIMDNVASLSDQELRSALKKFDISPGPITDSTRNLYRKKLASLIEAQDGGSGIMSSQSYDSAAANSAKRSTLIDEDDEDDSSDEDFEVQDEDLDAEDEDEEEDSDEEEEEEDLMSELQDDDLTLSRLNNSGLGDISRTNYREASANKISRGILIAIISFFVLIFSFYLLSSNNSPLAERLKPFKDVTKWILLAMILSPIAYVVYRTVRYYRVRTMERNQRVCKLVGEAIELLQSPDNPKGLMPILHIRDTLLTPAERKMKHMNLLWQKAAKFIEEHESRIKVELINIDGEDFRAWKWIGSRKL